MGCECREGWYSTTEDTPLRYELGPAYEDYKEGRVSIDSKWEQNTKLIPDWIDQCCAEKAPDWTSADEWQEHTAMLVCFYVYSMVLLGAFIRLRDQQPIRFRDAKAAAILWAVQVYNITAGVVNGNMGGTASTIPSMIFSYCGGTLVLYYYVMKCVQVHFVYAWNEAKLQRRSMAKLMSFRKFSFILTFQFYLAGFVAVFILCMIPMLYAISARDAYSGVFKYNQYDSLRCEWWHIPKEYTTPTSDSELCACLMQLPTGDKDTCASGVAKACFLPGEEDPAEAGFCDACLPEMPSGTITSTCRNWFEDFYASGSCGMPSRIPRTATCGIGVFADRTMGYVAGSINFFFMFLNLAMIIPLLRKRDDFGIIQENIACCAIVVPSLLFCYSPLLPDSAGMLDWYLNDLNITYRPVFFFLWLGVWGSTTITFGYPLWLYFYSHRSSRQAESSQCNNGDQQAAQEVSRSERSAVISQARRVPKHAEREVELCVRNPLLLEIYKRFAVEAFHVENVQFLEDCYEFLEQTNDKGSNMNEIIQQAQHLHNTYLAANAVLEVNVPDKLKRAIQESCARFTELVGTPDTKIALHETLGGMFELFTDAYEEIRKLVATDCWPRFKQSRHYSHYEATVADERHVSEAVVSIAGTPQSSSAVGLSDDLPAIELALNRSRTSSRPSPPNSLAELCD